MHQQSYLTGDKLDFNSHEQMNIVIVGHVDHGKSTLIGRLLADTNSLPEGKLIQVQEKCRRESKVFEYAFLLDALKEEQNQGITIDSARCFFKSKKRNYIIIDAPGHIEFLKNMISGASRAEAALIVIDANEGVKENSYRHGYMLSLLGIKQVVVCVNKIDLVGYNEKIFGSIEKEFGSFLQKIGIKPKEFIPLSALKGDNIAQSSSNLEWFRGHTVLEALDSFEKEKIIVEKPFRMPVQDVYKFTDDNDNRRIIAGRIESGSIRIGDKVIVLPSGKNSIIKSIEVFNGNRQTESADYSTGFTLVDQIYVPRGELMCKENEKLPYVSTLIKANIFWMGNEPMIAGKKYKLKLGTAKVFMKLREINNVLNTSNLYALKKEKVECNEAAECTLECQSPIAFDLSSENQSTGRFVIVDDFNIAGGGIIAGFINDNQAKLRGQIFLREQKWEHSFISRDERSLHYGQVPKLILLTGHGSLDKKTLAKNLESLLFKQGRKVYFLGIGNLLRGLDADIEKERKKEHIRRLGEVSHILMDAGLIVIATASDLTDEELRLLQTITYKDEMLVVRIGSDKISEELIDLNLNEKNDLEENLDNVLNLLKFNNVIFGL